MLVFTPVTGSINNTLLFFAVTCNWCIRPKCNPGACQASRNFNAGSDAEKLAGAMQRIGTKEDILIDILTHRSDEQIERIRQEYQETGSALNQDISGDTSMKIKVITNGITMQGCE